MTAIIDHGVQVSTARQWTTGLSPNSAADGWNYISCYWNGAVGEAVHWAVVKDLTTVPNPIEFDTTSHNYPNSNFNLTNQNRAANGRIFFPCFGCNVIYYDPTTETINELPQIIETPPVDPNASTTLFSTSFDVGGQLYMGTQESHFRPAMIARVDPVTLTQTVIGYVGNSDAYTTYAFRIAPDTVTASKYVYTAFGENPWQLWATNVTTGISTQLYEVPASGNIFFQDIAGQGWVAVIDTALGLPGNVRTQWWCLDGAIYPYTSGHAPPVAGRNVTPASAPLTSPPQVDGNGGAGIVKWRFGASPYTTVNYPVIGAAPIAIESLVNWDGGVVGNTQSYNGFFKFTQPSTSQWFGNYFVVSRGPRLTVGDDIFAAGYPNGVLVRYRPAETWDGTINPELLGYYGLNGTQFAGIKYTDFLALASNAGTQGILFACGSRERNGVGSGIGGWNEAINGFFGTYAAAGMDTVVPSGMCALEDITRIVMGGRLINPPGSAPLLVFDYDLNLVFSGTPLAGVDDLGQIYKTGTPGVITGIRQGTGNTLNLWQYDVVNHVLLSNANTSIVGGLQPTQYGRPGTNKVYVTVGDNIVRVDVDLVTATVVADVSSISPVNVISLAGDGVTMFAAGGVASGVSGATMYSFRFDDIVVAEPSIGLGVAAPVTLNNDGSTTLIADPSIGMGLASYVSFAIGGGVSSNKTGNLTFLMRNNEGSTIQFGQPVYASDDLAFSLASANSSGAARVIGLVTHQVGAIEFGLVRCGGTIQGEPSWWDSVCGTTGGLSANTPYYLTTVPGKLSATPPTTGFLNAVIEGLSNNLAKITIRPPVGL